jgi:flagellar protein FliO/FliZ
VSSLFGTESRAILFVVAFAIILALVALFGLVLRRLTGARLMMPGSDRSRSRQPRLGIVDVYDLDRQRQLLLLRRDNVEHLLLIGGPNDVVIETNIVRVAGARIPAPASEPVPERFEPQLDQAPRAPQVEPNGRPSIEAQLAAQLGSFVRRPNENSDANEELAPVASISAPVPPPRTPLAPEPVLKPDAVSVSANPVVQGLRTEARTPAFPSAPEPIVERPEPRPAFTPPAPPPFQSRATPTAPVLPVTPPVAPEPISPFQPAPVELPAAPEKTTADPVALSNMAKQLEEALKRPAAPVPPPPMAPSAPAAANDTDYDDVEDDDFLEPGPSGEPLAAYEEEHEEDPFEEQEKRQPQTPRQAPEPVRPAPSPLPPQPAESGSKDKAADPFSVEEIEAEFARLLGRPVDTNKKS